MKKRYVIVPVVCLVIALISSIIMTLFSTTLMAEQFTNAEELTPERRKKIRVFSEIAYKLDNNYSNLNFCALGYSPNVFIFDKDSLSTLPEDYNEKCVKYCTELYNLSIENYKGFANTSMVNGDIYDSQRYQIVNQYLSALYFTGQTEKAKQEAEKNISKFSPEYDMDFSWYKTFLSFVYFETNVEADKQWAISMNEIIIEKMRDKFPEKFNEEYTEKYMILTSSYKDK